MPHEVFISYCSEDKAVADAVCAALEANKARCWIAPRDVPPGAPWGRSIIHAINASKVMVVIFSGHTNASRHVMNEIERAVSHGATIMPFRIEDVKPSEDLELFISSCHWLDALNPPLEEKIGELARAVCRALGREDAGESPDPAAYAPLPERRRRVFPVVPAAIAGAVVIAAGFFFLGEKATVQRPAPSASPAPSAALPIPATPAPSPQSGGVTLKSPPDGASALGSARMEWSADGLDETNLEFELRVTGPDGTASSKRFPRVSHVLRGVTGDIKWKVRPVWAGEGEAGRLGPWSEERSLAIYADALDRVLATGRIHVGTAESGNIFVVKEDGEFTGFDIELLRRAGNALLKKHGRDGQVTIDYTYRVWGEELFKMPYDEPAVDLLASGISITPAREQKYRLAFTRPILEYPQTIVTLKDRPAFGPDGAFAPETIAATASTTNESLARTLVGGNPDRFVPYTGSGTYDRMIEDLLAGKVGALLIDKPYVLQKIAENWPDGNPPVQTTDALPPLVPGVEPEKIGFALRATDRRLLEELNTQLEALEPEKPALIRRFFSQPEAFLGKEPPL